MKPSDRYLKIVEWSEEDGCYVGTCPGLMLGGVHGRNETKVYQELCEAVEEWIRIHQEDGEPLPEPTAGREYSGKFVVRVGKDLHRDLAIDAHRHRRSLNSYCVDILREREAKYSHGDRTRPAKRVMPGPRRRKMRAAR
ncbi:MAG: toxin-antitoxin system HicB family antitoxin [Candidatus Brocadiia bacterium]|jgi:predicted HicB family RNase H-like nuclease